MWGLEGTYRIHKLVLKNGLLYTSITLRHDGKSVMVEDVIIDTGAFHTIISTVFIPLSFIVGLYGMNLKDMPEYNWTWIYPVVWVIMISIATSMLVFFKKKKWW